MKTKNIIFLAAVLSVFLVGISVICADEVDDAFGSKTFNINGTKFTTPDDTGNASSHGFNASFAKKGYVCDVKVISDNEYNTYKKWISAGKDDKNGDASHKNPEEMSEILQDFVDASFLSSVFE